MLTRRSRQALQAGSAFLAQAGRTANAAAVHPGCACGSARTFSDEPTFDYEPDYGKKHDIVRKHGVDVLHDPLYNKVNCSQPGSFMCSCTTCGTSFRSWQAMHDTWRYQIFMMYMFPGNRIPPDRARAIRYSRIIAS